MSDAAAALFWLLANVLLVVTAWVWSRRVFPNDHSLEAIGHTLLLCWACIVTVATVLGTLGCLSGPAMLLGVPGVCLVALVLRPGAGETQPTSLLPSGHLECLWLLAWGSLVGFWVGHITIRGILRFPADWDSLNYHLPLVDQWLQSGSLCVPDCAYWTNPGNNELLVVWAVGPFSGDFFASFNNLPAVIIFATSAFGLARRLGFSPSLAHLTGFALVSHFVILNQLIDAENDVAVAAAFFATLQYAFRDAKRPSSGSLLLGALSLGLLSGVKFYALGYAALALFAWILLAGASHGSRRAIRVMVTGSAGCLALGGYWYIRNFLVTGSPFYPKELFKQPDMLSMLHVDVVRTSFFGNHRPELLALYLHAVWKMTGPIHITAFVLAPIAFVALVVNGVYWVWSRRHRSQGWVRLTLAGLLLGSGLLLGMTPFAVEDQQGTLNQIIHGYCPVRYGLCFLSISVIAVLSCLHDAVTWERGLRGRYVHYVKRFPISPQVGFGILLRVALGCSALFQLVDRRLPILALDNFLLAITGGGATLAFFLLLEKWPSRTPWFTGGALAFLLVGGSFACDALADRWHRGFDTYYDKLLGGGVISGMQRHATAGDTVLVLTPRFYPFFGSRRQFRPIQPMHVESSDQFSELIRDRRISWVVSQPSNGIIDKFQNRYPDRLTPVADSFVLILYRVRPPSRLPASTPRVDFVIPLTSTCAKE